MSISTIYNEFILISILGWIYECTYCTLRTGHWQNRGFMFGPICPIYGAGAMLILAISVAIPENLLLMVPLWQFYLLFMVGSAVLEYAVSWGMEQLFHARWWDYSDMPLNLHGRICLPATILFGAIGILLLKYIQPLLGILHNQLHPALNESAALIVAGLFGADLALSLASISELIETLEEMENSVNEKIDCRFQAARQIPDRISILYDKSIRPVKNASRSVADTNLFIIRKAKSAALHVFQIRHLNIIQKFQKTNLTDAAEYVKGLYSGKADDK